MINRGLCDKGFIWNPSNCWFECNKSCDVGEYLDYSNCKWTKKVADKLVEECTENIDEAKITEITEINESKCKSSYTIYVVIIETFLQFAFELVLILLILIGI